MWSLTLLSLMSLFFVTWWLLIPPFLFLFLFFFIAHKCKHRMKQVMTIKRICTMYIIPNDNKNPCITCNNVTKINVNIVVGHLMMSCFMTLWALLIDWLFCMQWQRNTWWNVEVIEVEVVKSYASVMAFCLQFFVKDFISVPVPSSIVIISHSLQSIFSFTPCSINIDMCFSRLKRIDYDWNWSENYHLEW